MEILIDVWKASLPPVLVGIPELRDWIEVRLTDHVRSGWSEFLGRYRWDVFATLTYAQAVRSSEKVLRDFHGWLWSWQVEAAISRGLACRSESGRVSGAWANGYRKGRFRPVWVVGVEPHRSGALHAHAVVKWSDRLPDLRRSVGWSLWTEGRANGWSRLEPPRCQGDVTDYVSKYVTKGEDLFLSPSFSAAVLPCNGFAGDVWARGGS